MDFAQQLRDKAVSADELAGTVNSGDLIDYGMGLNQPDLFDHALARRRDQLTNVGVTTLLSMRPRQVLEVDPDGRHFRVDSWHFSGYDRSRHDAGIVSYIPFNLGEAAKIYREWLQRDLAVIKTSPMDRHGYFNFGISNVYLRAACDVAKRVVVETCSEMPVCYGLENVIHISEVEAVIEGDNQPLPELPPAQSGEVDRRVAAFILERVKDGSCLQIGIGSMPNAVCSALAESAITELGIHTEMFVDGMVDLWQAGKVTGAHKASYRGKMAYSFALGTQRLYDFLDRNEICISLPASETNLTENIARNRNVVSINNCMQIDLQGQVSSESNGFRHRTGTGGQLQFVRGAFMSEGGQSFICLSSRYKKGDREASRIVLSQPPGSVVTTPRTDVMYVVTEYGIVNLKGKSVEQRARALIGLAHPDDRDGLEQQARDCGLITRRSF